MLTKYVSIASSDNERDDFSIDFIEAVDEEAAEKIARAVRCAADSLLVLDAATLRGQLDAFLADATGRQWKEYLRELCVE